MDIRNLNSAVASVPAFNAAEAAKPAGGNDAGPRTPAAAASAAAQAAAVQTSPAVQAQDGARDAPDRRELQDSVNRVNEAVKVFNSSVRFSIDEETQQRVVRVVDLETDEVIRQIPSEEVLAIAKVFDKLQGLLIKDKA